MKNTTFTKSHKKFFSTPRTMQEITELFKGDIFEANSFQSVHILGRNLKTVNIEQKPGHAKIIMLVNFDYVDPELDEIGRLAAHG